MSAISLVLLLAAGFATAVSGAALYAVCRLRRRLAELRVRLAAAEAHGALARAAVPPARTAPDLAEIRSAVADALAEERERELAEARAFWAAQEARDARAEGALLEGRGTEYEGTGLDAALLDALLGGAPGGAYEGEAFVPRQLDREGFEPGLNALPAGPVPGDGTETAAAGEAGARGTEPGGTEETEAAGDGGTGEECDPDPAELAAARRRHPSNSGFGLDGEPVDPVPAARESTHRRLAELADTRTPLTDVRPGPLGTLDIYVFADGTTVCMAPGHRGTAERLAAALREGTAPVLLGGSGVFGAYTLTFACGEENVYVLADRIIASP